MDTPRWPLILRRRWAQVLLGMAVATALGAAWVAWVNRPLPLPPTPPQTLSDAERQTLIQRGAYLSRVGNCMACHTAGGAPYAGGRGLETPFGTVYAGNLTPHASGLQGWSADDFWRALHEGRSQDGRLLYPAFPYTAFTRIQRADSDALHAYLQSLPPVAAEPPAHELRWPYSEPWALAVWRALNFRPQTFQMQPTQSADWNRGAYLVTGLGHCASCHAPRNALGATLNELDLAGGLIPVQTWYAPALGGQDEARDLATLLRTGQSPRGSALGPMAEVVRDSTQHLRADDLNAMALYLGSLPPPMDLVPSGRASPQRAESRGAALYASRCAACHGSAGDGQGLYPPLAGNRTVNLVPAVNVIKAIRHGGFAPSTQANPRPFGMPPFGHLLSDADIAAVATHIRQSWGNQAPAVTELEVLQARR